ncbi:hypothetical protein OOO38_002258 [Salmonella enterica]|nr:hypothetical protein [Salmonella enterica]EKC2691748.1 hypothetical protein [Salmonella enterica]
MKSNLKTIRLVIAAAAVISCSAHAGTAATGTYADHNGLNSTVVTSHAVTFLTAENYNPLLITDLPQASASTLTGVVAANTVIVASKFTGVDNHKYVLTDVHYAGANTGNFNTGFSTDSTTTGDFSTKNQATTSGGGAEVFIVTTQKTGTNVPGQTTVSYTVTDYSA